LTVRQPQGNLSLYLQRANSMSAKKIPSIPFETTLTEQIGHGLNGSLNEWM